MSCWRAATGSAPTRGTPTTPAATPRPRAPRPTRSPASRRRAALGQGLRRRPRHAHRGRPRGAAAGPAARAASTSTPASSARTRWSPRSTTACTAGAARRRRSTPPCTASSTSPHVDHLHPDSGIAIATAADGAALTKEIFGDRVLWVPWRRPGFQLGLDIAAVQAGQPAGDRRASSAATASPRGAATSEECEANSLEIIRTAAAYLAEHGRSRPVRRASCRLRAAARGRARGRGPPRCSRSCGASPRPTGRRSATSPTPTSCWTSSAASGCRALAALGTSCPDHFLRTKVRPLVLDLPPDAPLEEVDRPAARAARGLPRRTTAAYYERHADPGQPGDARRRPGHRAGARRRACSPSARTSRPRGWPASSTSTRST